MEAIRELFPMFVDLARRKCVVVGAGAVGSSKAKSLMECGAQVLVIAPQASRRIQQAAGEGRIEWRRRQFRSQDLEGAFLVAAATSEPLINERVWRAARLRGVLCNVADDPSHCDFFYPAVVRRGALQIAISTSGASPALARRLRRQMEKEFGPEYQAWLAEVAQRRRRILASVADREERRRQLVALVSEQSRRKFSGRKRTAP